MSLAHKLELRDQYVAPPPRAAPQALPAPAPRLVLPAPPVAAATAPATVIVEGRPVRRLSQAE
jgi:hypothetical protein